MGGLGELVLFVAIVVVLIVFLPLWFVVVNGGVFLLAIYHFGGEFISVMKEKMKQDKMGTPETGNI